FTTSFTFRLHDGTDPRADGFGFVIQADPRGTAALGPAGGGLGYGPDPPDVAGDPRGIRNSAMVKFHLYPHTHPPHAGNNSPGIFTDGRSPSIRRSGLPAEFPDRSISLAGTPINLNNQEPKRVLMDYDGTTLVVRIEGEEDPAEFVEQRYTVDIRSIVGS